MTLCLSQPAWESFAAGTRRGGLVVYESELVSAGALDGVGSYGAPFTAIARREAGTPLAANVVSLAALARRSAAPCLARRSKRRCGGACRSAWSRPT